jgi:hypothetical protein
MKWRCFLAAVLWLAGSTIAPAQGIKPRAHAGTFPVSTQTEFLTIGAARLSRTQAEHSFVSPGLGKGYVVVEIGVYPKRGALKLDPANFVLRIANGKTVLHAAAPETVALGLSSQGGTGVAVYQSDGIGYTTGRDIYGQHQSGVITDAQVDVAVRNKPPLADDDYRVIEAELKDKALPSGDFDKPVAGYLYFPAGPKKAKYALEYRDTQSSAVLSLPAPK